MTIVFRSSSYAVVSLLLTIGIPSSAAAAQSPLARPDEPALARASEAVRADPDNAARWVELARAYSKAGHLTTALESAKRALAIDRTQRDARLLIGDCFVKMGRFEEAIEQLEPAEADYANDRTFAYVLGTAYIEQDRGDDGRRLTERLVSAGESAEGHVLIARARLKADDVPSAIAELKRAEALNPRLPIVHALMGLAFQRTGDEVAALAAFRKELAINPNDFDSNLQIGEAMIGARRYEAARSPIKRATLMRPYDLTARFAMARIFLATGQPDEARVMLEWVVRDDPNHADAQALLGTLPRPARTKP